MRNELSKFFKAFTYAANGFVHAVKTERNMRFHLCAALTVTVLSQFYELSKTELCILALCIFSVIGAELINTAIENAVDLISKGEITNSAKIAKDCAAGAVLITSIGAAVCGVIIFGDVYKIREIFDYLCKNLWVAAVLVAAIAAMFVFVFRTKGKD